MSNDQPHDHTDQPEGAPSLFSHLIIMLATSALQQMGRMADPSTGQAHVSLEGAQATIDLLDVLQEKTRGNLDADEDRLMRDTLSSLKLMYVEAKRSPAPPPPASAPAPEEPKPGVEPSAKPPSDEDKTRYRKSYG